MIRSIVLLAAGTVFSSGVVAQQAAAPAKATDNGPRAVIEQCAQKMLDRLNANRADYKKNPAKVYQLVDEILLPNFDTETAAKQILGRDHWPKATPDQRKRFTKAFYQALLKTYGTALVDFTSDRLVVLPFRGDPSSSRAMVNTRVKRNDGSTVEVGYAMRKMPDGSWKAWDVIIEGISYVANLRDDMGAEISSKGLDAVIKRLETEGYTPPKKS